MGNNRLLDEKWLRKTMSFQGYGLHLTDAEKLRIANNIANEALDSLSAQTEEERRNMEYAEWALKLIGIIAEDERLALTLRLEEIKVAARTDDAYRDSFNAGDSPEDAWQGELDAIQASQ